MDLISVFDLFFCFGCDLDAGDCDDVSVFDLIFCFGCDFDADDGLPPLLADNLGGLRKVFGWF